MIKQSTKYHQLICNLTLFLVLNNFLSNKSVALDVEEVNFEIGKSAIGVSPLFILVGGEQNKPEKHIIFYEKTKVIIHNLDRNQEYANFSLPKGYAVRSAPIYDDKTRILYLLIGESMSIEKERSTFKIFTYHLETKKSNEYLMESYIPELNTLECKTALGINNFVDSRDLIFACSTFPLPERGFYYGSHRGRVGIVIGIKRSVDGSLQLPHGIKIFRTSKIIEVNPNTGFNTGIYNAGMSPTILDNGDIIIATGNGPTFLDQENFGCSLVLLDGKTFQVRKNKFGEVFARSLNQRGHNECWLQNLEFSNSSAVAIKQGSKHISAIYSKDGYLHVFNPYKLDSKIAKQYIKMLIGEEPIYGEPILYLDKKGTIKVITVSSITKDEVRDDINFSTKKIADESIENYFLSKKQERGRLQARGYYSGPITDDYVVLPYPTKIAESITGFFYKNEKLNQNNPNALLGLFYPFQGRNGEGYFFSRDDFLKDPQAYEKVSLYQTPTNNLYTWIEPVQARDRKVMDFDVYLKKKTSNHREQNNLVHVYLVKKNKTIHRPNGIFIRSYSFNPISYKLNLDWENQLSEKERGLFRITPLFIKNKDLLVLPMQNLKSKNSKNGILLFINTKTGKITNEVEFSGYLHFMKPTFFDNHLYLATKDFGLYKYKLKD